MFLGKKYHSYFTASSSDGIFLIFCKSGTISNMHNTYNFLGLGNIYISFQSVDQTSLYYETFTNLIMVKVNLKKEDYLDISLDIKILITNYSLRVPSRR